MSATLVLLRHGQSVWNLENRFTGWVDVDLTDTGAQEALRAGALLKSEALQFDCAYTSVLKRAIRTLWSVLEVMDQMWIPVIRDWRLNERHYGALQGLDKAQTTEKHGEAQVKIWRRSYDIPPPPLDVDDPGHPRHDRRYRGVAAEQLPSAESLASTLARVLPCWDAHIAPDLKAGRTVLVTAHGNSLRALYKHLNRVSDAEIVEFNIPTGVPIRLELDGKLQVQSCRFLGDPEAIRRAAEAVANQARGQG